MSPRDAQRFDAHKSQEDRAKRVVEESHEAGSNGGGVRIYSLDGTLVEKRDCRCLRREGDGGGRGGGRGGERGRRSC